MQAKAKGDRTLRTWIPKYLNAIENQNYSPNTIRMYAKTLNLFAQFRGQAQDGASDPAVDTTVEEISDFFAAIRKENPRGNVKATTINQYCAALRAFYKYLLRNSVVAVNPMDMVERPKIKGRETIRLHHKDVMEFIEALRARSTLTGARDALLVRTIYATGMRISEVCNLQIKDIDFGDESIRVLGKGGKVRTVLCDSETLRMIQDYIGCRSSGPVFITNGHAVEPQSIQKIFQKCAPEGITPHKIRHSFASEFYKATHDLRNLQVILGHASIQTTQIYVHTDAEQRRRAYQSFPLAAGM